MVVARLGRALSQPPCRAVFYEEGKGVMCALKRVLITVSVVIMTSLPAGAHSPEELEAALSSREKYFQPIGKPAPETMLEDADGRLVKLADFHDKVVVLHFVYTNCPDVCPLHTDRLAVIQAEINLTPMKDQVQFVTVTTAPRTDTADVMRDYGPLHGLDAANWVFLTSGPDRAEDTTRKLAKLYGHKFVPTEDGYQMHGVVTHLIDREGIWRGNFYGLRFNPNNFVAYIDDLANDIHTPDEGQGLWRRILALF